MESICIFCGSSTGNRSIYQEAAQAMGEAIARRGLSLIYGGGNVGLMGMVADAALAAGGEAIGVIPKFLVDKEIAHNGLTQLHVVDSMHDRKALMTELADAFIALPGGYGTLEEFCEILTWAQLGLHQKPQGLLNVEGYYDPLLQLFDRAVTEDFLRSELRSLVLESSSSEDLLDLLASYQPITVEKWLRQDTEV
ncbi:TIGR00730 family Rossman fold protein [Chroococcidiopsis sp. CCALA 051]|uniref:LOG family protein n=1 Tax=Chroococcidiopsis sp. CCALA 051 TaxID=869949 RepID=UPI000D0D48F0|nr:TIGR00730 family Rossman fold protein [Chroococcidiopsis sp. CCALA 051]MBE9016757.1 TIGR00730 family Rossman fold protein [Chroococcidiopsidales cyanobacterium LEGE 13417]PSM50973.1 TIGR00730 family Rossman fold protein [Chroococcidiopsis sp. CCALA 051]